jgi:hypothetical protein
MCGRHQIHHSQPTGEKKAEVEILWQMITCGNYSPTREIKK